MFNAASNVVWIILAILFNGFDQNSAAFLRCYGDSFENHTEVPLKSPDTLITDAKPCIDVKKPTMVYFAGADNKPDSGEAIRTVISEYILLETFNVILLNWAKESRGIGLGPLGYPSAVTNSKTVAEDLAIAVVRLVELGLNKDIHYLGHSLGAQLACQSGRESIKRNLTIPWLTALDPARLGFDPVALSYAPVDTTCAAFVDAVHCDPGGYGMNRSTGHINMYPNYGFYTNGTRRQPGCSIGFSLEEIGTGGNRCSHDRCWMYYSISLTKTKLFILGKAQTYYEFVRKNGVFDSTTYLGPEVNKQLRGDFFCITSATNPFGLQEAGLISKDDVQ